MHQSVAEEVHSSISGFAAIHVSTSAPYTRRCPCAINPQRQSQDREAHHAQVALAHLHSGAGQGLSIHLHRSCKDPVSTRQHDTPGISGRRSIYNRWTRRPPPRRNVAQGFRLADAERYMAAFLWKHVVGHGNAWRLSSLLCPLFVASSRWAPPRAHQIFEGARTSRAAVW